MYQATTATQKLARLRKRIRGVAGGTSAGKTISIEQLLIDDAQTDTTPTLTSIVSESFPHLKRGAMRDFQNIMQSHHYWVDSRWNASNYIYTLESGSQIEFFSADQPSKVRGPRRDRLFINEGNNIPYEAVDQLLVRTKEYAWIDWNPTNEFYFYTDMLGVRDDIDFITLTYKDNEALDPRIVADIEAHRHNKNWWTVYGLGQLGEVEGKIFTGWQIVDQVPHEARLERRGLDFGYSNDPTALVGIHSYNGGFIWDEELYQKGLSNKQIADFIKNLENPHTLVIADSAEPKSIDELSMNGVSVLPAQKGQGSVLQGIQYVQGQRMSITKRSVNGIKEYRNYMWMTDKEGRIINVPEPGWDHLMDAGRYGMESLKPSTGPTAIHPRYARGWQRV
jgi:phage terminase large subunit